MGLYKKIVQESPFSFFIIQDYSYAKIKKEKEKKKALEEFEAILHFFEDPSSRKSKDPTLFLLSGTDLPLSDFYAVGALQEKFCGLYHSSQLKKKIIHH